VAQVGDTVRYQVDVTNEGDAPLDDVFVVDLLPREVTFVSAHISPDVEATLYGRVGPQENITWNVGRIRPGQTIALSWAGTATSLGDMSADNVVRAVAAGVPKTRREDRTYLASSSLQSGPNPNPTPVTRKTTVYERVPSDSVLGSAEAEGAGLPTTGFDPRFDLAVGAVLLGAGALLWWGSAPGASRRRRLCLVLAAVALLTACTAGGDSDGAGPETTVSPQVKGRRISESPTPGPGQPDTDEGPTGATDEETPPPDGGSTDRSPSPPPEPPVAAPPVIPPTELVPHTELVVVEPDLRPALTLTDRSGDNEITYEWDESGGSITSASSSTLFDRAEPARLETSLEAAGGGLRAVATLTNTTSDRPVVVHGRILYEISGSAGSVVVLESAPIDVTLQPGGATAAVFSYNLPSGGYSAMGSFRAN
jgi:uncharacterized repeat protein (TIGR01451 family)